MRITDKKVTNNVLPPATAAFVRPKAGGKTAPFFMPIPQIDAKLPSITPPKNKAENKIAPIVKPSEQNQAAPLAQNKTDQFDNKLTLQTKKSATYTGLQKTLQQNVQKVKRHRSANNKSEEAQHAAEAPRNERLSRAQNIQLASVSQTPVPDFDTTAFKTLLQQKINAITPQTEAEAQQYNAQVQGQELQQSTQQIFESETAQTTTPLATATTQTPPTQSITEETTAPITTEETPVLSPVSGADAVPPRREDNRVNFKDTVEQAELQMQEANLTNEQLTLDPAFTPALTARQNLQQHSLTAPGLYRQNEQQIHEQAAADNQNLLDGHADQMLQHRSAGLQQVTNRQHTARTRHTNQRAEIAAHINQIYTRTQTQVTAKIQATETQAKTTFEQGTAQALQDFTAEVQQINGNWVTQLLSWIGFMTDFKKAAQKFHTSIHALINRVANMVTTGLNEAKQMVATGKEAVVTYINQLPRHLQKIGREEAQAMQERFNQMEQQIQQKYIELADSLAQSYHQTRQQFNQALHAAKAENRSLWQRTKDAVSGVIQTIADLKNLLTNTLQAGKEAISAIIRNPVTFFKNLWAGIKIGFQNFIANISTHLQRGMLVWLFAEAAKAGIQLPQEFSAKSIIVFITELLGLTYANIRRILVKLMGERVISAVESTAQIFILFIREGVSGVWQYIKTQLTNLKETIMEKIQSMIKETIVEAAYKWLLSLFTPAGAFIKACMTIYDLFTFFVSKIQYVAQLIRTIAGLIIPISQNNVTAVAAGIENALSQTLPLTLGFMANLLGIGKITGKVKNAVYSVQASIERVIIRLLKKAAQMFRGAAQTISKTVVQWWKHRKRVMLENGEIHTLFFENDSENGQLMIASKTKPLRRYLNNNMKEAHKGKPNVLNKIQDAIDSAIIIDKIRKTRDPEKHELIRTEMNRLAKILKEIPAPPPSELPPSVVEYGQVRGADGDATSMTAWILSKKNIVGSPPRASTKLWKKVKKKKFKKSGATRFVRGHLLNEWFGGPGDPYNLTPITRTANKKHVSDVENPIWDGLNEGKVYYYKVKVVYKEGSNEEVAEKLICVWQELEYKSKKWERKKGTRKKVVIDNA
ncbi:MAG TPA: DNA/RNA non-specific endonuclease [Chitinophagales bacterium]|nr:DNA/RNA non-specific endonuclease [Chitinophagales bacterium]